MIDFWEKARLAAKSARLLLDAGDPEGAANRAYYAMFDVARSELMEANPEFATVKTHGAVIQQFSLLMVKQRGLDPEHGRSLRRAFEVRLIADYSAERIEPADARAIVDAMEAFLAAMEARRSREPGGDPP